MKKAVILAILAMLGFSARAEDAATGWGTDLTNALQTAKVKQRPVLLEFTAPWCPYCRQMEGKTFKDQQVVKSLDQFERVSVNIDRNPELAAEHGVHGIPAFVVLDFEGDEAAKTSGFMDPAAFNQWLAQGVTNLTTSTAAKEEFQTRTQEVEAALASADPAARAKGVTMALDCCERREKSYRTFALEKLQGVAKNEPRLLLDGLIHPGLMARINASNLLREKFGDGFNIDPWEKAEVRERDVREWKTRLEAEAK